ncbi:MAG: hypothetical protein ACYDDU_16940 [Dermatophilaceae bacterium]
MGHVQRGGAPSAFDRCLATLPGHPAWPPCLATLPGHPARTRGGRTAARRTARRNTATDRDTGQPGHQLATDGMPGADPRGRVPKGRVAGRERNRPGYLTG